MIPCRSLEVGGTGFIRAEVQGDTALIFVRYRKKALECPMLTVLVDAEDLEKVLDAGSIQIRENSNGYYASIQNLSLQRFIMGPESDEYVDHSYGNTLDNRKRFLKNVTPGDNRANQTIARPGTRSKLLGVRPSAGRWVAVFTYQSIQYTFGYFDDPELAAKAYTLGRQKVLNGELNKKSLFANPNWRSTTGGRCEPEMTTRIRNLTIFDPIPTQEEIRESRGRQSAKEGLVFTEVPRGSVYGAEQSFSKYLRSPLGRPKPSNGRSSDNSEL